MSVFAKSLKLKSDFGTRFYFKGIMKYTRNLEFIIFVIDLYMSLTFLTVMKYMGHVMRKRVLCHMRTTKVQISLRIRAV